MKTTNSKKTSVTKSPVKPMPVKSVSVKKSSAKKLGPRAIAAQVIREVHFQQRSLSTVLPQYQQKMDANQQAFVQQICYGSLRWFLKLETRLKKLLKKPPRAKDNIIYYLLITGLYQLLYMHKPDYAVVKETVAELKALDRFWAKGLVNAILRSVIREQEALAKQADSQEKSKASIEQLHIQSSHPQWFVKRLQRDWSALQIEQILNANNQQPPFWLRFNQAKISKNEYQQLLENEQLEFEFLSTEHPAIHLKQPINVDTLPGFKQGLVSVQDAAAQCAANLLDVQKGHRVLDACAAPGGKTSHILEKYPQLASLLAIDISSTRLEQITSNFERLGLNAELLAADAAATDSWWDGEFFDRILLDAPCSAMGVIRRHPDIKLLRKDSDIEDLSKLQESILEAMWSILKPGGLLLYATCSVLRDENDRQIEKFMQNHNNAQLKPIQLPWGRAMQYGWQILPGEANLDGFYYAAIVKAVG
ncbi:MAG: 16S rRNA (cytosine(967)-C(5))-methyltransferase RsmB [Pseudomonadota bacterium]